MTEPTKVGARMEVDGSNWIYNIVTSGLLTSQIILNKIYKNGVLIKNNKKNTMLISIRL